MVEGAHIGQMLRHAVAEGVAPGMAFAIVHRRAVVGRWFAGHHLPGGRAVAADTVWDLASLTKPLTTVAWCRRLVEAGRLDLEAPLGRWLTLADPALAQAPVWRLLNHTSGLPAWRPYHEGLGATVMRTGHHAAARRTVRRMLLQTTGDVPPGTRECYSDLGFLMLELVCEAVDRPLAEAWPELPFHGPDALHFRPLPQTGPALMYAATERCPWRGRLLQGEVHDDNCWLIGGVGGHAGLFGTLDATVAAVTDLLAEAGGRLAEWLSPWWLHPHGTFLGGFDTPTPGASTSGTRFGRKSFGHLGFTGTSFWIDPEAEVAMVLLTNRVCPTRANLGIRWLRPALHDAAWGALDLEVSRET